MNNSDFKVGQHVTWDDDGAQYGWVLRSLPSLIEVATANQGRAKFTRRCTMKGWFFALKGYQLPTLKVFEGPLPVKIDPAP